MVDAPGTTPRARPSVVTLSSWLLILVAVIQVLNLIVTLAVIGKIRDVMADAYAGTSAESAGDIAYAFTIGSSVLTLLLAIGLVVLAMLNNRGKNASRITTWVVGGILLCCTGGGLLSGASGGMMGSGGNTSGDLPSTQEVQRRVEDALPSWHTPVSTLLGLIALLALLGALILLALPKANEFFRKPKAGWEPPVPGGAYPAYPPAPGQSGDPGYPSTPGQSGDPAYPSTPGQPAGGPPAGGPPPAPGGQPPAGPTGQPGERRDPEPPAGS
ncbi:hypothetical protein O7602_28460 [Micromonospora sp. WMMD1128]|uniref:hypothetical protein n=1 Tax=unclassified Micromonospora TaxID=2617518 RepID=UPI00248ADAFD|nr:MULTISPECIES: hypothetical protein [unclassified Micromonospora]WBB73553.1 hypothetical protein O7602_28460 [Micromonospora sp. WMMD1128]WFE33058.1 hypothetical protein O7613_26525 [Micromonospora sp. WMMD975]